MVVKRADYTAEAVAAARSVLLELTHLLEQYQAGIVVVGGWVPELSLTEAGSRHIGSLDVDVALDHHLLKEAGYKTIRQLLLSRGYRQDEQPYVFWEKVRRPSFCSWRAPESWTSTRRAKWSGIRPRSAPSPARWKAAVKPRRHRSLFVVQERGRSGLSS